MNSIQTLLGDKAGFYLGHTCKTIPKEKIHLTTASHVDDIFLQSDRNKNVINNLRKVYNTGRLARTGYLSILPVDQGVEHGAGASFAKNSDYFDPEQILKLAVEGGCNAVASTFGVLGLIAKKYAEKIPFIVKLNHNEFLSYPNSYDQILFGTVQQACDMGAAGVGATVYFGSVESRRQITEIAEAFAEAHRLGMFTVLWCYLRNVAFQIGEKEGPTDYHFAADLTGQANYLGVTIQADLIKQKLPINNRGIKALNDAGMNYSKMDEKMYTELASSHPIDLCRYQVANCYMGRIGLINSGGPSGGAGDVEEAVVAAVINKRAGGSGLIMGRKAFQKSLQDGIEIIHAVQDVYLDASITVA